MNSNITEEKKYVKELDEFIGRREEFLIDQHHGLYESEWYSGTTSNDWRPYFERSPKKARFALVGKGVCYLAKSCDRIDFEAGDYFYKHKIIKTLPDFGKEIWPRITGQVKTHEKILDVKGAFKIVSYTKIFDLSNLEAIKKSHGLFKIVFDRGPVAYGLSSYFASEIYKQGFDGILYKPCTSFSNPWLGPGNDPMIVLFEPQDITHKIYCYYSGPRVCF